MVNRSNSSCTRYGNNLSLLIKSGNIRKQLMISQTTICSFQIVGGKQIQKQGHAKTVVIFTFTKMSYFVIGLLHQLMRTLSYLYIDVKLFALLFALVLALR